MSPNFRFAPIVRFAPIGWIGCLWGVGGVTALLFSAVWRLAPVAMAPLDMDLGPVHWAGYAASVVFMGVTEGYQAFQRRFSPRVVLRALHLGAHPRIAHVLLAPAFCMGFFHATRRRVVSSWMLSSAIVCLVLIVRRFPQPLRGIVDAGVVVGLTWGVASILLSFLRGMHGQQLHGSADLAADPPPV